MSSRVNQKFSEWTHGCDTRQSMISIFSHIRDIPYSLEIPTNDPATAPEKILSLGKGSCSSKHYLLAEMYKKLNLAVVYATFPFLWNEQDIQYPKKLREQAARLPVAHHLACRVQIGCRWVLVDATWDRPLANAGFPVNAPWDGYSEMKCAVKPLKSPVRTAYCRTLTNELCREKGDDDLCPVDGEKDHWEAADRARYYSGKISRRSSDEVERIQLFSREFSSWLETVRASI